MTTYYMGLTLPTLGISTTYVSVLNSNLDILDTHDHVTIGALLNQDSISWSDLDLSSSYMYGLQSLNFFTDTSYGSLNLNGYSGNLYFGTTAITNQGTLNLVGVFTGFFGNMSINSATVDFEASITYSPYVYDFTSSENLTYVLFEEVYNSGTTFSGISTTNLILNSSWATDSQTYFNYFLDQSWTSDVVTTFYITSQGYMQLSDISFETFSGNEFILGPTGQANNAVSYYYQTFQSTTVATMGDVRISNLPGGNSACAVFDTSNYTATIITAAFEDSDLQTNLAMTMLGCNELLTPFTSGTGEFPNCGYVVNQRYCLSLPADGSQNFTFFAPLYVGGSYVNGVLQDKQPRMNLVENFTVVWPAGTDPSRYQVTLNKFKMSSTDASYYFPYGSGSTYFGVSTSYARTQYQVGVTIYDTSTGLNVTTGYCLLCEFYFIIGRTS